MAILLALLVGASVALRIGQVASGLWMDEGISVGLASHPLGQVPGLLRVDGSPPLYYLLLHGWMAVFGRSEAATHALSLVASSAAIPVALWAGWSLFSRRAGWVFAILVACSPYLSDFATETRMYALVFLLALLVAASFLHAFVFARRRYLWLFAASLTLLLYTHNWGLWMALGAVVALVPCAAAAADRRRVLLDAALSFGTVALAYLPWIPTLAFQRAHTGAPWSLRPSPREAVSVFGQVLGAPNDRSLVVLLVLAGLLLWSLVRRRNRTSVAVAAVGVMGAVPVAAGWLAAQVSPSWAPRYLAVCAPAVLLLAAVGLTTVGARGLIALGVILAFWVQPLPWPGDLRPAGRRGDKQAEKSLARAVVPGLGAGDLVVVMQMEEVPVLAYYLPPGVHFATAMGVVADASVADWREALPRLRAATVAVSLRPLLDSAPVGNDVVLVCAQPGTGPVELPWFALMDVRCREWRAALEGDDRFAPVAVTRFSSSSPDASRQVLRFTKKRIEG